ncbi:MAG: recombination protein RecR [Rhodospirillales bacterium]|nr:recombination protein RecR [Rhodospirillales bacterium]
MSDGPIDHLIRQLSALPGLGPRSARRAVLHLLSRRDSALEILVRSLEEVARTTHACPECGNLDTLSPCRLCRDTHRRPVICVVASVADLWAVERTKSYRGRYHVLGGVLSALGGTGPEDLKLEALVSRVRACAIEEVILALGATVEGQATAHYVADMLRETGVRISRLSHGVPVGGELDYLDDGTIALALTARTQAG